MARGRIQNIVARDYEQCNQFTRRRSGSIVGLCLVLVPRTKKYPHRSETALQCFVIILGCRHESYGGIVQQCIACMMTLSIVSPVKRVHRHYPNVNILSLSIAMQCRGHCGHPTSASVGLVKKFKKFKFKSQQGNRRWQTSPAVVLPPGELYCNARNSRLQT